MSGKNGKRRACLLVHGFTGGPYELAPLAEYLEQRGWHCAVPTLAGHQSPARQLKDVSYVDWIEDVVREAKRLKDEFGEFDVVGFSMGGLLAAHVANRYPVRRLVLLNAAVIYVSPGRFAKYVMEHVRERKLHVFRKARQTPLAATAQFMRLARRLRGEFARLRTPTLIVQGELDQIVHPYSAVWLSRRIEGETEVLRFSRSRHLICWDPEAERVAESVSRFLANDPNAEESDYE